METAFATIMLQFWAQHESSLSLSFPLLLLLYCSLLPTSFHFMRFLFSTANSEQGKQTKPNETKRNETHTKKWKNRENNKLNK